MNRMSLRPTSTIEKTAETLAAELANCRGGTYQCPHCGGQHASDDTELWCGIAQQQHEPETKP